MTPQEMKQGKERVRLHLLEPLNDLMRYRKPRKVKTEMAHVAALAEMQKRLAYLTADELDLLRETVIEAAPVGAEWPPAGAVIQWARHLRKPPEEETGRVVRLIQWAAGKDDIPDRCLPALYEWLRANSGTPGPYDLRQMEAKAEEDERWMIRAAELEVRGIALSHGESARTDRILHARARVKALLAVDRRAVA